MIQWDLKEGHDSIAFMESMISDDEIKKVIMICDKNYSEKANQRSGGVGTEAQIISSEIYKKSIQSKFVAVVFEADEEGKPFLPAYYTSRIYIDLTYEADYAKNFEQLLRWIFDEPLYKKPKLGTKPNFLDNANVKSLRTNIIFNRLMDFIKNDKHGKKGVLREYFEVFSKNLEEFRIIEIEDDEVLVENLNSFIPYRNEFADVIKTLIIYEIDYEIVEIISGFFESLIHYYYKKDDMRIWKETYSDNFKFIIYELFLYLIYLLIQNEKFEKLALILSRRYFSKEKQEYGKNPMQHYSIFRKHVATLEGRNKRLKLNRLSLCADMIKERAEQYGYNFNLIMQADFVLYLRGVIDRIRYDERDCYWFPNTLVFSTFYPRPFDIFERARSTAYFNRIKILFNIDDKNNFEDILGVLEKDNALIPNWQFDSINPRYLLNFENLCTYG